MRRLGKTGRKRPFLTQSVPILPLPVGDKGTINPDETSFEGSYVAVSGRPGSRTVHVVNGRGGVNIAGTGIDKAKYFPLLIFYSKISVKVKASDTSTYFLHL